MTLRRLPGLPQGSWYAGTCGSSEIWALDNPDPVARGSKIWALFVDRLSSRDTPCDDDALRDSRDSRWVAVLRDALDAARRSAQAETGREDGP